MKTTRLLMHPILNQKRSLIILSMFTGITIVVSGILFFQMSSILKMAEINMYLIPSTKSPITSFFLSNIVRIATVALFVFVAASITSKFILGPVKRIEQWLQDLEAGYNNSELKVRSADEYGKLIQMINTLYEKAQSAKKIN